LGGSLLTCNIEEQQAIGEAALEKALRSDPYSSSMLLLKADLLLWRGRFEESLLLAESVLTREPDNVDAMSMKAQDLLKLGKPRDAARAIDDVVARSDSWGYAMIAAAIYYAGAEYELSTRMAQSAKSRMSRERLASPRDGPVALTLAASQARLGHLDRARDVLSDFKALVPGIQTTSDVRKWMHPAAELAGFEPLYDGLRLAGMPD